MYAYCRTVVKMRDSKVSTVQATCGQWGDTMSLNVWSIWTFLLSTGMWCHAVWYLPAIRSLLLHHRVRNGTLR